MVSNITTMNFTVSAPIRKKTVLVFDVETSGLLPKKDKSNLRNIDHGQNHRKRTIHLVYKVSSDM